MRTVPNMYILNLAISDIIYLTVLFLEVCANRVSNTWLDGDFMCTFFPFCRRMSVGLSPYSVVLYSIQQYRVAMYLFQARVSPQATWRVTVATICGVWTAAALFAVPSALSKYLCKGVIYLKRTNYYPRVVVFELMVSCGFPLCVIAFTFIMTARHLVESFRSIPVGTQIPQLNTTRNTAKILLALTVAFLISCVPYHACWTYINYTEKKCTISDTQNYRHSWSFRITKFSTRI